MHPPCWIVDWYAAHLSTDKVIQACKHAWVYLSGEEFAESPQMMYRRTHNISEPERHVALARGACTLVVTAVNGNPQYECHDGQLWTTGQSGAIHSSLAPNASCIIISRPDLGNTNSHNFPPLRFNNV